MARNVLHIDMPEQLLAAVRFAAARDSLAPSQKARQILMQALQRTMDSQAFQEHLAYLAGSRTSTPMIYGDQAEEASDVKA